MRGDRYIKRLGNSCSAYFQTTRLDPEVLSPYLSFCELGRIFLLCRASRVFLLGGTYDDSFAFSSDVFRGRSIPVVSNDMFVSQRCSTAVYPVTHSTSYRTKQQTVQGYVRKSGVAAADVDGCCFMPSRDKSFLPVWSACTVPFDESLGGRVRSAIAG